MGGNLCPGKHLHIKDETSVSETAQGQTCDLEGPLDTLSKFCDHSWVQQLVPDPETEQNKPNKRPRQVREGHYVLVEPTPLSDPQLVAFSAAMAKEFSLSEEDCQTEQFIRFFSGDLSVASGFLSWATPYALSIYGDEMTENCPFGTGNGYGDGRAMSVGEIVMQHGVRWELQLKGCGTTPFCRGADGRAVLRSSVREFLASEAMHHLGVSTTRALSLIVSKADAVRRPWYSGEAPNAFSGQDPDTVGMERCAITCRTAPSFLRVGHVELFARRARSGGANEKLQLEMIVKHLLFREYSEIDDPTRSLQERILVMLQEFAKRLAKLAADWLRVGYCQGNFNSDNCLAAGRTMDYGPFGFMEAYSPSWCMWVGGGDHFSFVNQPAAAGKNFATFCSAVSPLLDPAGTKRAGEVLLGFDRVAKEELAEAFRRKLGLQTFAERGIHLYGELDALMQQTPVDYTILWRQLAKLPEANLDVDQDAESLLEPLRAAFYVGLDKSNQDRWEKWLRSWLALLSEEGRTGSDIAKQMRHASPKYVPREWMLEQAYKAAAQGNFEKVHELQSLFERPYDEQPEFEDLYYRRAELPNLNRGGIAYMS